MEVGVWVQLAYVGCVCGCNLFMWGECVGATCSCGVNVWVQLADVRWSIATP